MTEDTSSRSMNARVSRVEAGLHSIQNAVESQGRALDRILSQLSQMGRPNWAAAAVTISVVTMLIGFFGYALSNERDRTEHLDVHHDDEVKRNNEFEKFMGRQEMINELFVQGKLKLQ